MVEWDSRDGVFCPTRGGLLRAASVFYGGKFEGGADYETVDLDARWYFAVDDERVLAVQAVGKAERGTIPFTELARLDLLRGVKDTRFTDRFSFLTQAEYRFPLRGPWSGVVFAGTGEVSHRAEGWTFGGLKAAGGAGIRYALDRRQKIHLRLDVAAGPDGINPYFQMLEAF